MISNRVYIHSEDYVKIVQFLREMYVANQDQTCWLPQRWEDLEFRIRTHYLDRGEPDIHDSIRIWEKDNQIVGVCHDEDKNVTFMQIRNGFENLFSVMLDWSESRQNSEIIALNSCDYKNKELIKRGYKKEKIGCYHNYQFLDKEFVPILPDEYEIVFGDELEDKLSIARVCHFGFHPENEGNLEEADKSIVNSFKTRESAPMFNNRYEVMTRLKSGELTSYLYGWVDIKTMTAMVEPVSTRMEHRHKGLGKAMLMALMKRLKEDEINICMVESFDDDRRSFYNSAGFITRDIDYSWKK